MIETLEVVEKATKECEHQDAEVSLETQAKVKDGGGHGRPFVKIRLRIGGRSFCCNPDTAQAFVDLLQDQRNEDGVMIVPGLISKAKALDAQLKREFKAELERRDAEDEKRRKSGRVRTRTQSGKTAREREKVASGAKKSREQRRAEKIKRDREIRAQMKAGGGK
jgi:hypothetical protein